eukprot:CAMPEP_0113875008 /NCGR_PEP_ID=MMETSP0780_2-20120614/4677_1 /TAXON_ID=652834 /ORGANISM="Palpitomonas bilix" /LENGTH=493 /DNA_ID=CAMNT_0000860897 /DNA_START=89 /DNA_END=1570 /DNA_ORIENTATION=+ /assembly_acc=CAM_ASM_000599
MKKYRGSSVTGVVRESKFRHIFGKPATKKDCYEDLRVETARSLESNLIAVSSSFIAVPYRGGGGPVLVLPHTQTGRVRPDVPTIQAHTASVSDVAFSPFDPSLLATAGEDHAVRLWRVPAEGVAETVKVEEAERELGHDARLGALYFNPSANGVLATTPEGSVDVWDVEKGERVSQWKLEEGSSSAAWDLRGSTFTISKKDHSIDVVDLRLGKVVNACPPSASNMRIQRVTRAGEKPILFSTNLPRTGSERSVSMWDERKLDGGPISSATFDNAPGVLIPLYDVGTGVLYLAGKGDTKIGFSEAEYALPLLDSFGDVLVNDGAMQSSRNSASDLTMVHYLGEVAVTEPHIGIAAAPASMLDVKECEVARFYRLTKDAIEPISFFVPRAKKEFFQDDIYPDLPSHSPALSAQQWRDDEVAKIELESRKPEGMVALSDAPKEESRGRSKTDMFKEEQAKQASQEEVMSKWSARIDQMKEEAESSEESDDGEWDSD